MSKPVDKAGAPRVAPSVFNDQGNQVFEWNLSSSLLADLVQLPVGPDKVLPVIFVPGIMGSNLKSIPKKGEKSQPVWRLDAGPGGNPVALGKRWGMRGAGKRQRELHPARTTVDDQGSVPKVPSGMVRGDKAQLQTRYRARGWGQVAESSYHEFLLWLENTLNNGLPPHQWKDFPLESKHIDSTVMHTETFQFQSRNLKRGVEVMMPGLPPGLHGNVPAITTNDLLARARFLMPVHACGYNWLDSNEQAAKLLAGTIEKIIKQYGKRCNQVIVMTHSMGGLVARRCAQLPGMAQKIAGVVHGVMPATGAAVAYRRCKLGVKEENAIVGAVMGWNGREVTAVFAQAPGALQLLPSPEYGMGWLKVTDPQGRIRVAEPTKDPYTDIYLRRDRWWGLVRKEWLAPQDGKPITWREYEDNISEARSFHKTISFYYHSNTYVYYGDDPSAASFEKINWRIQVSASSSASGRIDAANISQLGLDNVFDSGTNPLLAGRETSIHYTREGLPMRSESHHWMLRCDMQDGSGDGTVPASSGAAPMAQAPAGRVRVQARLSGFEHEPAYKNAGVQQFTLYSLLKIASSA